MKYIVAALSTILTLSLVIHVYNIELISSLTEGERCSQKIIQNMSNNLYPAQEVD